ncbi:DUF3618 domain-containing protein [Blastococcus xanthinilyticus]|uniref:Uncharacterized protein DUF3618 n=1 Tax=Blastococcus xanthinilyticus TaxID=1564164 RepID=A0A5S5CPT3_9ACTN|nr:DUF3618 domain-containing protein [Blastococcus xanthinilyticus]TYP81259.1 uncharacterized protein DUF3618 [Blastococcus xanthinilyticus]
MPRDPRQIQLEIDSARESLAATLDQLAYRSSPTRLKAQGRDAVQRFLQTPAGQATVGAVGLLVTLVVVQKVRHRKADSPKKREPEVVVEKVRYRKR